MHFRTECDNSICTSKLHGSESDLFSICYCAASCYK